MTFTPKWRFDLVLAVIIGVWFGVGRLLFRHLDIDVLLAEVGGEALFSGRYYVLVRSTG